MDFRKLPFVLLAVALPLAWFSAGAEKLPEASPWEILLCNPLLDSLESASTWEAARSVGVRGIEIHVAPDLTCPNLKEGSTTPFRLDSAWNAARLRSAAERNGLSTPVVVSPIRLEPGMGRPDNALKLIEVAPQAGVRLVYFPLVTQDFRNVTFSDDEFVKMALEVLRPLVEQGKRSGVGVAIENLSVYWNRPEILRRVLGEFGPQELGLCLDPINLYWFGHPRSSVYTIADEFMPRTRHFHVKNVAHPEEMREVVRSPGWEYGKHSVPVDRGDVDFKRLLKTLKESGYDGAIAIEDDSLSHFEASRRVEVLREDVSFLRGLIESL